MSSDFNWVNVWQIGCGNGDRDFRQVFFDYGILLMGASYDMGPYDEKIRPYDNRDEWGDCNDKIWPVAVGMELGDTVILKNGKKMVGVGRIVSDYYYDAYSDWEERFSDYLEIATVNNPGVDVPFLKTRLDDVEGWDLRHTRQVEWWLAPEIKCNSLSRGACNAVHSPKTIEAAKTFLKNAKKITKTNSLPEPARVLSNNDLIDELMDEGLSSSRSEELSRRLSTLQRLANWYYERSGNISEHEIRAYLVWPLLQVLGWSEQCVKFEWKNLDLALLNKPYLYESEDQIPLVIGETKTLRSGLFYARKQAENYAEKYKVKDILVTDGVRYLYRKRVKSSNEKYYYMNLLKLRKRHPYYGKIEGANELLKLLLKK